MHKVFFSLLIIPGLMVTSATAQTTPDSSTGFFTAEQAERGAVAFYERCGECHGLNEFTGEDFEWTWRRQSAWDFFLTVVDLMPEDAPGSLDDWTYVDIIAYLLQGNEYEEGNTELEPTEDALGAVPIGPGVKKTKGGN